jgi:hypothetical protein
LTAYNLGPIFLPIDANATIRLLKNQMVADLTEHQSAQTAVIEYLSDSDACFVQDIVGSRRLKNHAPEVEEALLELERDGRVLIRPHSAGDPHLDGADLRIVALVPVHVGDDALATALSAIDKAWDVWLAQFLASHRCI